MGLVVRRSDWCGWVSGVSFADSEVADSQTGYGVAAPWVLDWSSALAAASTSLVTGRWGMS